MADTIFLKDNLTGSVPVEISSEVIKNIIDKASVFKICKHEPMKSDTKNLPYLTDNGSATWVAEGGVIGTTIPKFSYPQLKACKLAVIIPVTREKINDSIISVFEECKGAIADSFANAIDKAVIFGTNSPFTTNLFTAAGTQKKTAGVDTLDSDISDAMALVEVNKLTCTNILMGTAQKQPLRALVNSTKYKDNITLSSAYDLPIEFVKEWDNTKALSIIGDFTKAVIGTREEIFYQVLDQATIGSGESAINLAERDMIAVKATMRLAFVVAEPKAFSMIVPPVV